MRRELGESKCRQRSRDDDQARVTRERACDALEETAEQRIIEQPLRVVDDDDDRVFDVAQVAREGSAHPLTPQRPGVRGALGERKRPPPEVRPQLANAPACHG